MNITLNRREFLAAAKRAASIAPAGSPVDMLRGVLLETDRMDGTVTMLATNLEVAIEQKIRCTPQDDDALVINASLLEKIAEKLAGETLTLQREGESSSVVVTSADARFDIPVWESGGFPKLDIPFPEDTVKLTGLPAITKRTVFAAGDGAGNCLLRCVNLMFTRDGLKAACSDGNCIVTAKGDNDSTGDISLLVPALSMEKLARMSDDTTEYKVGTTGKTIVFFRENFAYSARLMDGEYIDIERLMSSVSNVFTVLTDVSELKKCVASVVAVEPNGKIMLRFQGSILTMGCIGAYGSATSQIKTIPLIGTPQGEYWFLSRQLSACLHALDGTVTLGIAQGGMLTLSTENAYYMQPGVRAPNRDISKEITTKTVHKQREVA